MIEFWLLAALLTLVSLALILTPLLRRRQVDTGDQIEALNTRLYQQRLAELQTEQANGNLDAEQLNATQEELARELLHDTDVQVTKTVPASTGRNAAIAIALSVPLAAVMLYQQLGSPDLLGPLEQQANAPAAQSAETGQSLPPVEDMLSGLRARLKQEPDNAKGWQLLGRSYVAMQRYGEAESAYAKAFALQPDDPSLLVSYAEAMALANDSKLLGRPTELLQQALRIAPNHPDALWLGGLAALQAKQGGQAVGYWRSLLQQLEADSPDAQMVRNQIARIDAQMAQDGEPLEAIVPAATAAPATDQSANQTKPIANDLAITVSVSLDPALVAAAAPNDTLFIYARATQGPRMPLAMARKTVRDLPVTVTLDDSSAMMPAMKLSGFEQVMIMARVSKSGTAMTQSGDLLGSVGPVVVEAGAAVTVSIGERIP